MILNHFVDRLVARNIPFVLLKDERCPRLRSEDEIDRMEVLSCKESIRKRYYKAHRNEFSTVLCLGNVPPAIRMPVKVYTYIHNVSLLKIPSDYPLIGKMKAFIKKNYIRSLSDKTDSWIVQTSNTSNLVQRYLPSKEILVFPFYYLPEEIKSNVRDKREDYIFIGEHTNAKGHEYLIEAWKLLANMGFHRKLHLTVSKSQICAIISDAQQAGANIENHGYVNFDKVVELYKLCKATVYPSLNESLGLGIIEAAEAGCDVIGCDLPYLYCVCNPSEVFVPKNPQAIMEAVLRYEQQKSPKTKIRIRDKADELIDLLCEQLM